jgi:hypothetical protein
VRRNLTLMLSGGVLFLATGIVAQAASFSYNFNNLAAGIASTCVAGVCTSPQLEAYMNDNTVGPTSGEGLGKQGIVGGSVKVTGTGEGTTGGALTEQTYTGDDHVVGACAGNSTGSHNCAATLGTDTYLRSGPTITNGVPSSFTFAFTLPGVVIDSVTFDYEIFPDGTCASLPCGTNTPDMIFSTNLGQVFHDYGTTPVSPNNKSWLSTNELAPQKLVLASTWTTNVVGATTFTFTDWPAGIGIDNFVANYHKTTTVPEPTSITLLATITGFIALMIRRRMRVI